MEPKAVKLILDSIWPQWGKVTPAPAGAHPPRDADCYDEHLQGDVEVEDD